MGWNQQYFNMEIYREEKYKSDLTYKDFSFGLVHSIEEYRMNWALFAIFTTS